MTARVIQRILRAQMLSFWRGMRLVVSTLVFAMAIAAAAVQRDRAPLDVSQMRVTHHPRSSWWVLA
jgi:hypothetical protein